MCSGENEMRVYVNVVGVEGSERRQRSGNVVARRCVRSAQKAHCVQCGVCLHPPLPTMRR